MTTLLSKFERPWLVVAIAALAVFTLIVDVLTPVGYAEWALYAICVSLTLFQRRTQAPFAIAALTSALSAYGLHASPAGIDVTMAIVNRSMGFVVTWSMAFVIWQALTAREAAARLAWLQGGLARLGSELRGDQAPAQLAESAMRTLTEHLDAPVGSLYRLEGQRLILVGGVALPAGQRTEIPLTEGVLGQAVARSTVQVIDGLQASHLQVQSALGTSPPVTLLVAPITADGAAIGGLEIALMRGDVDRKAKVDLLTQAGEMIGIALRTALYRKQLVELLEETQRQSEELQQQQEELRVTNEELEQQSNALQQSQAQLEAQQASLEEANVRLEERNQSLARRQQELLVAQHELSTNAQALEAASRYKSEFLANMSHELRTPLNSSLILAKILSDNKEETLTAEQVKYAKAIYASNNDLLALINDILDLSKVEAGHVELAREDVKIEQTLARLRETFEPMTSQKNLGLRIESAPGVPAIIETDAQRLQQILKNLLANAVKFTDAGHVSLTVEPRGSDRLAFHVEDTGIGIPAEQQDVIFEAFRQADGSTNRRFGGTGLGLSISRELARRMGGDIAVSSQPGRGSRFTLELPLHAQESIAPSPEQASHAPPPRPAAPMQPAAQPVARAPAPATATATATAPSERLVDDDFERRSRPGRLILGVEDDPAFAQAVVTLAHEMDFDCVIAPNAARGLELARELMPSAILLDLGLPDASGLAVLEQLKRDPATRHIPVHVVSAMERGQPALELGAVGFVLKPATRDAMMGAFGRLEERMKTTIRHLLIVEDDAALREHMKLLLSREGLVITDVGLVADALAQLRERSFDCVVTDLALPDGSGYDLLERMAEREDVAFPPVIVYTGRALTRDEEQRLRRYSKTIIVKGARSPERLLDEVTLFLHSVEASLPPEQQRLLRTARQRDSVLDGRTILLAEDDVRNIFALASVFEPLGAKLEVARNGREALERLNETDVDLILMDIMMPEMDGLEAMRRIRAEPRWRQLPIIALTAKAMADDRELCLQAGANDYMAKPIDADKLVSLCRVWCPK